MRLIIIRHGDPDYEKDCLTPLGIIQAQKAAVRLMEEDISLIYSSPLGRALQTAQVFSEMSGTGPVNILEFMKEIRYGREDDLYSEEGHPWINSDKMIASGMDIQDPGWRDLPVYKDNTARIDADNVMRETDGWLKTLGYEREGLYYRNKREDDSQITVALFCHGGSATAMLSHIYNQQFPFMVGAVHMAHTAITTLRFDRTPGLLTMPVLELLNDDRHIRIK